MVACDNQNEVKSGGSPTGSLPNLPPPGKHSRGHIEIPAKRHTPPRQVNMLTLIKTDNWIQHHDGHMEYLSVHRYGEVFVLPSRNLREATLTMLGGGVDPAHPFEEARVDYRSFFFEGGYFADLAAMDEAAPGTDYRFDLVYEDGTERSHLISMPPGQIPSPMRMSLVQNGEPIGFTEVDPSQPLQVRWTELSAAARDPNRILDDLVTIAINDCGDRSGRIFVTGEPTLNGTYLTFEAESAWVPAETLLPGRWYWLESEFSDIVTTSLFDGAPVQAAYMNSVYLAIATEGAPEESFCALSIPRFD
jgi:hypothetical protein